MFSLGQGFACALVRLRCYAVLGALLAFAAPVLGANAPAGAISRHALVVGNAAYKYAPVLLNPANDSRDVCNSLKKLGYQTTCAVDVKTRGEFKDLVQRFVSGVKKGDVILFYFAGHGIEMEGENYLVPILAEFRSRGSFEDEAVRVRYVLDELEATGSRLSVIILDACRDNPFGAKSRSAVGRGLAIPDRAPAGSIIIFPTSPGKVALDGGGDSKNGLFTKHLLSHIQTPGLEVEAMFKRVIEGVKSESEKHGQPQIPWMNLSFTGEYCFAGCIDRAAESREKEALASRAKELEAQLAMQQRQADDFRTKMKDMEGRLASRQQVTPQDSPEFKRLEAERAELAKKVAMLENQEQGLKKAQQSLVTYRVSKEEVERMERELAVQEQRLNELDSLLTQTRSAKGETKLSAREIADLRKERDDLRSRIKELLAERQKLEKAEKELTNVAKVARDSEQSNKELAQYRDRLATLERDVLERERQLSVERTRRVETEEKLKDANRAAVKGAAIVAPSF
jgi:uncharacterized caspase-like protein